MYKVLVFARQEMISVQNLLSQKIPGFKFNLGFSGRGYKQGDEDEDGGDDAIIEHAHEFTWFGHLYDHEQAHKQSYKEIVRSLVRNEQFAKVWEWLLVGFNTSNIKVFNWRMDDIFGDLKKSSWQKENAQPGVSYKLR